MATVTGPNGLSRSRADQRPGDRELRRDHGSDDKRVHVLPRRREANVRATVLGDDDPLFLGCVGVPAQLGPQLTDLPVELGQ